MYIIGINAYHGDSSACLLKDGSLVAAAEEERFTRIKHWAGFPAKSIEYCLHEAGITLADVEHIAVNSDPQANFLNKIKYTLLNRPDPRFVMDRILNKRKRTTIDTDIEKAFPHHTFGGQLHNIEHHLSHLASAHNVSPFHESIALSVDGFGDFSSAAWGHCHGGNISVDHKVLFPHSLGIFYQAITQYIGFPNYGDEYKVMGLAPYGKPAYLEKMRDMIVIEDDGSFRLNLRYFVHHKDDIKYEWRNGSPVVGNLFNEDGMRSHFGLPVRLPDEELQQAHRDFARSAQNLYEEAFFNILDSAYSEYQLDRLTLAGGCAMNSVANGKVYRMTPFRQVYIQSAAGDAGGAIGAAMVVSQQLGKDGTECLMDHAYWGPSFDDEYQRKLLDERKSELMQQDCIVQYIEDDSELYARTAKEISEGNVIGWFQGRMEWGPRALGNRSILGDPRRSDMKDILNLKIKRRESFRPFAPSILREKVKDWFEEDADVPFMMQVFQIRPEKRKQIPAVTHIDGSGRLQTVHEKTNPRYHGLISEFEKLTDVPMLLNTSFNENEPVVCRPEEALNTFLRTKMDVLVLGNWFICRNDVSANNGASGT